MLLKGERGKSLLNHRLRLMKLLEEWTKNRLRTMLFHQAILSNSRRTNLPANEIQRILSEIQQTIAFRRQLVHFPRTLITHVPFTLHIRLLLQSIQQRINRARPKIHTKRLPNLRDNLITMHRLRTQELQYNQI